MNLTIWYIAIEFLMGIFKVRKAKDHEIDVYIITDRKLAHKVVFMLMDLVEYLG